ncbi:PDZ domain-containing protein [bacterium]|nr:PDZ domain-containing protein [bacterium]
MIMKYLPLFVLALLLFGCAATHQEGTDYNTIYMERCLSTGMMAVGLDDVLREETGLPAIDGMYIANVEQGSAAYSAHIKTGDVLLQVGDEQVYDKETFAKAFLAEEGKKTTKVKIYRGGGILTLDFPLTL